MSDQLLPALSNIQHYNTLFLKQYQRNEYTNFKPATTKNRLLAIPNCLQTSTQLNNI